MTNGLYVVVSEPSPLQSGNDFKSEKHSRL